jgi:integrase
VKIQEIKKTKQSFFEVKLQEYPQSTQNGYKYALNNFEEFTNSKLHESSDQVIEDLLTLDADKQKEHTLDIFQNWINWNGKKGTTKQTTRLYLSKLKIYFRHRKIKIVSDDIKDAFAKQLRPLKEEKYGLKLDEVRKILDIARHQKKSLYLALLSGAMRIGEAVQLRKQDFDFSYDRVMIKIPARITKTGRGRTTFLSKEAYEYLKPILKRKTDDDLVWGTNENLVTARSNEENAFRRYSVRLGFDKRYESQTRKITLHSFRAYFFTKAARIDENFAHFILGHEPYMETYDRLDDKDKLEIYKKIEPEILVFDTSKSEAKIRELEGELKEKIKQLEKTQNEMKDESEFRTIVGDMMTRLALEGKLRISKEDKKSFEPSEEFKPVWDEFTSKLKQSFADKSEDWVTTFIGFKKKMGYYD